MWSALRGVAPRLWRSGAPSASGGAIQPKPLAAGCTWASGHPSPLLRLARAGPFHAFLGASRGFYFPRQNWFPWRVRLIHKRQAALRKKRHIWPRYTDTNEAPIFGGKEDGTVVGFRDKEIKIGLKKLADYAKLIKGRQLEDAIDWVESLARMKSEPILKLLQRARKECIEKYNLDPARLYLFDVRPDRGYHVRSIRQHARGRYGINKAPRNLFLLRIREMPLEEFFHRLYIYNKVPRSLASDMRLALHDGRVGRHMVKEWAPYLCARSRQCHRHDLKWADSSRQFDYYQARREWIYRYKASLVRGQTEAREARGLPPLPVAGG